MMRMLFIVMVMVGLIGFASTVVFGCAKAVGSDVCDVGDVVEKFTGDPPGCRG
jgi:hypothetical protein